MKEFQVLVGVFPTERCKRFAFITLRAKTENEAIEIATRAASDERMEWLHNDGYDPNEERIVATVRTSRRLRRRRRADSGIRGQGY